MAGDELPDWQQEALDKLHRRLLEWLPDHKLLLVLIRAPFADEHGVEITDPVFERLLSSDPEAAQRQLIAEFEADRLAGLELSSDIRFWSSGDTKTGPPDGLLMGA